MEKIKNELFSFGFWPCGDRDGNPYVTPEISIKTAKKLNILSKETITETCEN